MINTLIALVIAATSLVAQAQQPNVTPEIRQQALATAVKVLVGVEAQIELIQASQVPSTPIDQVPAPVDAGTIAAAPQAPTCTLSAPVTAWRTTWHSQFAWTYTDGATAKITANGAPVSLNLWNGQPTTVDSAHQAAVYGPSLFADTDYEMDVTLNGLTGSCTAHATVPATPPQS